MTVITICCFMCIFSPFFSHAPPPTPTLSVYTCHPVWLHLLLLLFPTSQVLESELPVMEPYFVKKPDFSHSGPGLRVTWLGHATVLVEMDGLNILTDPMFSQRASPFQFMGPKRYRGPPCTVEQVQYFFLLSQHCTCFFFLPVGLPPLYPIFILQKSACQQLPRIDAVVISHSHYDHLDAGSVASLNLRFGGALRWYVL